MGDLNKGALGDLDIDANRMFTDPEAFFSECLDKADWLSRELDRPNNQTDIISEFKSSSQENKEAQAKATEIYDSFLSILYDQTPEVVACLLPKLSELLNTSNNLVANSAMRNVGQRHYTKRQMFYMYKNLKDAYESAVTFIQAFFPDRMPKKADGTPKLIKQIPGRSGNYKDTPGTAMYKFILDGQEYISPYKVAFLLGFEINTYMDCVETIKNTPAYYERVELVEF